MKLTIDDAALEVEREKLKTMDDKALVDYVESNVNGAAVLSSRGYGWCSFDQKCGLAYEEAVRRGKEDLYKRGYDNVYRSYFGDR